MNARRAAVRELAWASALAAVAGVLFGCAYPPIGWSVLVVAAAIPTAWIVVRGSASGLPGAARAALPWRVVFAIAPVLWIKWFVLHYWLLQVTGAGTYALALYCTFHELLGLWLLVQCARGLPAWMPWALLLPLALGAEEAFRTYVLFDGYPWFRWGQPLVEHVVLVQGADLIGEIFASLLVLALAGACVDAWCARRGAPCVTGGGNVAVPRWGNTARAGVVFALLFLLASFAYGSWRLSQAPVGQGPGILLVQTNLATSNKVGWAPREQVKDIPEFAELTMRGAIECAERKLPVALAVWPETMLAGYGLEPETIALQEANAWFPGNRFQRIASLLSERLQVPLLVGSPAFIGLRADGERFAWDKQFNSAYLVNPGPPPYPRYDKIFLAPFGETMPYISSWDWLEQQLLAVGAAGMTFDLDRGGEPVRFEIPWQGRTVRIAPAICFEDAMCWVPRDLVYPARGGRARAADLLVNITNDGWYGWFDGGRAQHLQISRFRCIETRTPMVRAANTGLCAGIDSSGRIVASPPTPQTSPTHRPEKRQDGYRRRRRSDRRILWGRPRLSARAGCSGSCSAFRAGRRARRRSGQCRRQGRSRNRAP